MSHLQVFKCAENYAVYLEEYYKDNKLNLYKNYIYCS